MRTDVSCRDYWSSSSIDCELRIHEKSSQVSYFSKFCNRKFSIAPYIGADYGRVARVHFHSRIILSKSLEFWTKWTTKGYAINSHKQMDYLVIISTNHLNRGGWESCHDTDRGKWRWIPLRNLWPRGMKSCAARDRQRLAKNGKRSEQLTWTMT